VIEQVSDEAIEQASDEAREKMRYYFITTTK